MNLTPFIEELKEYGINFIQNPEEFILYSENIKCRGFFSSTDSLLQVSSCKDWEEIFIHEFSHFIQYKTQTEFWRSVVLNNSIQILDDWLDKKIELEDSKLTSIIRDVFLLEKECEEIALKLIKEHNLPIKDYKEKAIKYLSIYKNLATTRKFDSLNY